MKAKCIKPLCVDGYQFEEGKEYDIEWKEFFRGRDDHDPVLARGHRVRHIQYAVKYNFFLPKMFGKVKEMEKVPAMLYLYDRQYCEHEDYTAPAIDPLGLTGGPLLCFDDFFKEVHDERQGVEPEAGPVAAEAGEDESVGEAGNGENHREHPGRQDRPRPISSGEAMRWNEDVNRRRLEHHERRCAEDALYRRAYERQQEMRRACRDRSAKP